LKLFANVLSYRDVRDKIHLVICVNGIALMK